MVEFGFFNSKKDIDMSTLMSAIDKDMNGVFSFEDFKNLIPMVSEENENG